jgi:hypothetical protein
LVVEAQEADKYAAQFGEECILVLPFSNRGSVIPARNWIKEHSTKEGHERHWQLDYNIRGFKRWYKGDRIKCRAGVALRVPEDFTDRYENIAIAGLNYEMFAVGKTSGPYYLNCHVYSCSLILNSIPHEWRGKYNEDTDLCLQVLADGWCTILFNVFLARKMWTMQFSGGNTDELYREDDGRLKMARSLERMWPGVVHTGRRFQRPQHVVHDAWQKFDTPLKRKPGLKLGDGTNEYGMELEQRKTIRSTDVKKILRSWKKR